MEKEKRKFKLKTPNSYVIIMAIIAIVAVLSWIIPGGAYDYVDPNADKLEPIAGTFHTIASHPQGLWAVIMAPITGFMDSVDIILYCLVIGGYIALVMKTGALDAAIGTTMKRLEGKEIMLIPTLMLIFSVAGAAFKTETHPDRIRIILPYHDLGRTVLGRPGRYDLADYGMVVPGTDCGIPGCKHHSSNNRQNQGRCFHGYLHQGCS